MTFCLVPSRDLPAAPCSPSPIRSRVQSRRSRRWRTVLPIQGTPGTGKTYVTARAILALVRKGDFRHGQSAQCRRDETSEVAPIFLCRARLQAHSDMFLVKALRQTVDRGCVSLGRTISRRILAVLDSGDDRNRSGARLIAGQHGAGPEAPAAWAAPGAVLHHEAFSPAWHHAQPEDRNALVPDKELRRLRLGRVDGAQ